MPFCKGLEIEGFLVGLIGLPAGENDADPLEGQGADGAVMGFAPLALTLIIASRPRRTLDALLGKFMESLADEFGPGKPSMNPKGFAAALDDRGDAGVFLKVRRVSPTRSIRTKPRQQTRRQLFASSWKTLEEGVVRMSFEKLLNLVIKGFDGLMELAQLAHQASAR